MASLPELTLCSIGTSFSGKCKKTIEDWKDISDFDDEEKKSLVLHCGFKNTSSTCHYHEQVYFGKFANEHGKYCCDPFNKHNKRVKGMSLQF